jgi:hypothetical protein
MKTCPQCRTSYTDDSLKFCLQDGTPLIDASASTGSLGETETVISPGNPNATRQDFQNPSPVFADSRPVVIAETPRKSNTGLIVALTALVALLAVVAAVFGVLYYKRGEKNVVVQNDSNKPVNTVNSNFSKANQATNTLPNTNTATPTVTPTPEPTLNPKELENIKSDVGNVVEKWKDASENLDLDEHLSNYADTVDYYKAGKVSIGRVRADKQRAYEMYDSINININNMKIVAGSAGDTATAVFDKEWTFEGGEKYSSGKVQQQLQFAKIGGKWRITGEKDLKVYYVNK